MKKASAILLCNVFYYLFCIGGQRVFAEEHKIVVIADPHVMAEELLVNDGPAFQKYLRSEKRLADYSQAIFDKVVSEITAMSPRPELVLVLGDLTKDGELQSHQYVRKKLDELKTVGISTLVIPGNHDFGKRSKTVYYDGDITYDATSCVRFGSDDNSLENIYADYGFVNCYKDKATVTVEVDRESSSSTLTYVCEPISDLVIIGIDSGNKGELSELTLDWVCAKAQDSFGKGKRVIAMMHYPLIPHFIGATHICYPSLQKDMGTGYEIVRNRLADAGISVLLTGHSHFQDIIMDWNADFTRTIYDVTTGSLQEYPLYYRVLTLSENLNLLSITSCQVTGIGNSLLGEPFSAEIAKARFTSDYRISKTEQNLIKAGVSEDDASIVAPYYGSLSVYHAEGDEHNNSNAKKLLRKIKDLNILSPFVYDKANSILLDISNYGDAERENQTDDLSLVINLGANNTTFIKYTKASKESNVYYSLGGLQFNRKPMLNGIYIKNGKKIVVR